jgi:hypothetical protein
MTEELTGEKELEAIRKGYVDVATPLFFPKDPIGHDIIRYFASLLRVVGMEGKGWDPYAESRAILEDLNSLMQINLPANRFPRPDLTILGLVSRRVSIELFLVRNWCGVSHQWQRQSRYLAAFFEPLS